MRWLVRQYRGMRLWWARRTGGKINVTWLGASPARSDNTEPTQRAVDLLRNAGGIVWFPAGEYHWVIPRRPIGTEQDDEDQ